MWFKIISHTEAVYIYMLLNDSSLASFSERNAAAVMFSIKVSSLYKLLYSALTSLELFHTMTSLEFFRRVLDNCVSPTVLKIAFLTAATCAPSYIFHLAQKLV